MTVPSTSTATVAFTRQLRAWLASPSTTLVLTLPMLALAVTALLLHTRGYHIDLEVYRLGVQAWLAGGDMYGPLPPTISGLALPFIYPPFAAMVLTPLVLLPWVASWIALFVLSLASLAVTLYVVAKTGVAGRRAWRGARRGVGGAAAGARGWNRCWRRSSSGRSTSC